MWLLEREFDSAVSRKRSGTDGSWSAGLKGECAVVLDATHACVYGLSALVIRIEAVGLKRTSAGTICPSIMDPPLGTSSRISMITGGKMRFLIIYKSHRRDILQPQLACGGVTLSQTGPVSPHLL